MSPTSRDANELSALEDRLRGWRPADAGLPREGLLFEAGRAAGRRQAHSRLWRGTSALLALVACGLGWGWTQETSRRRGAELALAQLESRSRLPEESRPRRERAWGDEGAVIELARLEPSSYLRLRRLLDQGRPLGAVDESPRHEPTSDDAGASEHIISVRDAGSLIDL